MGCFLACFSASNHPKSLKPPNYEVLSGNQGDESQEVLQPNQPIEQENLKFHISPISESHEEQEEPQSNKIEERVTFDLDIKSHEEFRIQEIPNSHHDELVIEESSESLFSLSIDSRKQGSEAEMGEKEVNSPMTTQHVHSLLNQVEILITPQKSIKEKTIPPLNHDQEKENINVEQELNLPFCEEPLLLLHKSKELTVVKQEGKLEEEEITVETSLSRWLVDPETPPSIAKKSPNSFGSSLPNSSRRFEGRPILGELNFEGVK